MAGKNIKKTDRPKPKKKRQSKGPHTQYDHFDHPDYGRIPLVFNPERNRRLPDPKFRPKLPPGAVKGNIEEQEFCDWCHFPKYYYTDERKICIECHEPFVFSGTEQKYWYETLKFNFYSKPIRCAACRAEKRREKALQKRLMDASHLAESEPSSAEAHMRLSKAIFEFYMLGEAGNLERGIAAARKAIKLDHRQVEALFWEARCLEAAQYVDKSLQQYELFLSSSKNEASLNTQIALATERIEMLSPFVESRDAETL